MRSISCGARNTLHVMATFAGCVQFRTVEGIARIAQGSSTSESGESLGEYRFCDDAVIWVSMVYISNSAYMCAPSCNTMCIYFWYNIHCKI